MDSKNSPKIINAHGAEHPPLLPEEIIEDILSRLPVKSLLRFRCVSKHWRHLIGSDRFIKAQLENSTKNPTFPHHRLILNPSRSFNRLNHCSLPSILDNPILDSFASDNSIDMRLESIRFVGNCNGLLCVLLDRKRFILWNPSIRMSKKLPTVEANMTGMTFTKYGFGYDASKGDYKVFAILSMFCTSGEFKATGNVYSLKANSWKRREDRDASPFDDVGKFVSGSVHWESSYGDNWGIASFDLKREVYGTVELPSLDRAGFIQPWLGKLGGCLCLLCDYRRIRADVWVMKEYGVKESWTKVVTLPYVRYPFKGRFMIPLCIFSNGEIVFVSGPTLVRYYPKDHVFRYHRIVDLDHLYEVEIYIESLVSIF